MHVQRTAGSLGSALGQVHSVLLLIGFEVQRHVQQWYAAMHDVKEISSPDLATARWIDDQ